MHKISAKQSKMARSLLKWNIYDLVNHVKGINAKRIDSFEHGAVHIADWENEEIVRAFKKHGILFKADMEVALETDKAEKDSPKIAGQGEGARIVLNSDMSVSSDSSALKVTSAEAEEALRDEKDKATR